MNQSIIYSDRLNTTGMKTPLMKHFCSKPQTLAETLQLKLIFSNTFNINMFWYKAAVVKKNEKTKKQNLCPGMYLYNSLCNSNALFMESQVCVPNPIMLLSMRFMILVNEPRVELWSWINILCSAELKLIMFRTCHYSPCCSKGLTKVKKKKLTFLYFRPLKWFSSFFWKFSGVCPCFHIHAFSFQSNDNLLEGHLNQLLVWNKSKLQKS